MGGSEACCPGLRGRLKGRLDHTRRAPLEATVPKTGDGMSGARLGDITVREGTDVVGL